MRCHLLATTAVLAFAVSAQAQAQDITAARTTPVNTSTANAGQPGAVRITSTGSVVVPTAAAVTMDSNHNVTNEGTIRITGVDNAVGITANAGTTGDISNTGTITIDENFTPTDGDNDGDLDGPFALGSGRYGIRTLGAHTGAISSTGTITVEGNNSYGIALGGPLTGNFTNSGTTRAAGTASTAIALGDVTGNVRLAGTIEGRGLNAVGAQLSGDITGRLVVQGALTASGYRSTTAPTNTAALDADDLLQGGSALLVEGNVTGGIVIAIPPKDADTANADEDADGIPDATEGSGAIRSVGAAPAMVIGSTTRDIVIGPVTGTASLFGLQVDGTIAGTGIYAGVTGTGLQIGGRGGDVTVANGIGVSGTISATSNGASATGLRLGAGATTPQLHVTGIVESIGGNAVTALSTAVQLDVGADVATIRNAGKIRSSAGATGTATAILDLSGNVDLVENSGQILATGATAGSGRNVAIDLSANNGGVIVRQTVVAASIAAPSIEGDVRFGTGNDQFDLADGTLVGNTFFSDGADQLNLSGDAIHTGTARFGVGDDRLTLAGSSVFNGTADFGTGADVLTLAGTSRFAGTLLNSANLAVSMTGGTLDLAAPSAVGSLSMATGSSLLVTLDKTAGEGTFIDVAGAATFATGTTIALRIADVDDAVGTYAFLEAGSLSGASNLTIAENVLPFMFKASLATDTMANRLSVSIARRTTTELGLNVSQTAAASAIFAALGEDVGVENLFLGLKTATDFQNAFSQMLPDHAGGTFEGLSLGLRTLADQQAEPAGPVFSYGGLDVIVNSSVWSSGKDVGTTAGYDLAGVGASVAAEVDTDMGAFGAALGWVFNDYDAGDDYASVYSNAFELALYWRGHWGGLSAFGRGSLGIASFNGERTLRGTVGTATIERVALGNWNGNFHTAEGGVSYEAGLGGFFVRPTVSFDYLSLSEGGHTDTGGGDALNLIVAKRSSDEFAVNAGTALGVDFTGTSRGDTNWFRVEGEGGWREIVGGALGATTAHFDGGANFTLTPEQRDSGWYARLRAVGGSEMFELGGELGAESRHSGNTAMTLRGTLRMGF